VLKHHFDNLEQQHASERLGIWMFLATEVLFFGGLFGAYTVYRFYYPHEFEYASSKLNRTIATVNTLFLITSSLTITLGIRAKESGVEPHVLYPSCEQFDRIVKAGPDSVFMMLDTIAVLTEQKAKAILVRNHKASDSRLVLLYGGAAHNDVAPRPGRESWSYAKNLQTFTKQRYVEVDLIVREYIKDTEVWQQLPWYPHFDKATHRDKFVLFNPAPFSYVLIFPESVSK
jgi:hypothetical protein